jgi:chitin elicitor receptor kinase 1
LSARAILANKNARDVSLMLAERKSVEFSYEELAAATDNFSISHKIGQGGFASVYFGEIHNQVQYYPTKDISSFGFCDCWFHF